MKYKIFQDGSFWDGCLIDDFSYHKGDFFSSRGKMFEVYGVYSSITGFMILHISAFDVKVPFPDNWENDLIKDYDDAKWVFDKIDERNK